MWYLYACIVEGWRYVFYFECAIFSMCMYGTHVVYLLCICVVYGMYSACVVWGEHNVLIVYVWCVCTECV